MPIIIKQGIHEAAADALLTSDYASTGFGSLRELRPGSAGREAADGPAFQGAVYHASYGYWHGGGDGEEAVLRRCYKSFFEIVRDRGYQSVIISLVAGDALDYPEGLALSVAASEIGEFLSDNDVTVYLVLSRRVTAELRRRSFRRLDDFVSRRYTGGPSSLHSAIRGKEGKFAFSPESAAPPMARRKKKTERPQRDEPCAGPTSHPLPPTAAPVGGPAGELEALLQKRSPTFSEMLLLQIDRKGKSDAAVYKRANIDRRLFSRIRSNRDYRPSKNTALAFAVALELNIDETADLLRAAGYALSPSSRFDLIVEYHIRERQYDIFEINQALFAHGESQLGS